MNWVEGLEKAVDYTHHCTFCWGVRIDRTCSYCEDTGEDAMPWAELFPHRRPE